MKLADIKKLSKRRAKTKNTNGAAPNNVYGGVGFMHGHHHDHNHTTTPTPVGDTSDGGGDGGGGGD